MATGVDRVRPRLDSTIFKCADISSEEQSASSLVLLGAVTAKVFGEKVGLLTHLHILMESGRACCWLAAAVCYVFFAAYRRNEAAYLLILQAVGYLPEADAASESAGAAPVLIPGSEEVSGLPGRVLPQCSGTLCRVGRLDISALCGDMAKIFDLPPVGDGQMEHPRETGDVRANSGGPQVVLRGKQIVIQNWEGPLTIVGDCYKLAGCEIIFEECNIRYVIMDEKASQAASSVLARVHFPPSVKTIEWTTPVRVKGNALDLSTLRQKLPKVPKGMVRVTFVGNYFPTGFQGGVLHLNGGSGGEGCGLRQENRLTGAGFDKIDFSSCADLRMLDLDANASKYRGLICGHCSELSASVTVELCGSFAAITRTPSSGGDDFVGLDDYETQYALSLRDMAEPPVGGLPRVPSVTVGPSCPWKQISFGGPGGPEILHVSPEAAQAVGRLELWPLHAGRALFFGDHRVVDEVGNVTIDAREMGATGLSEIDLRGVTGDHLRVTNFPPDGSGLRYLGIHGSDVRTLDFDDPTCLANSNLNIFDCPNLERLPDDHPILNSPNCVIEYERHSNKSRWSPLVQQLEELRTADEAQAKSRGDRASVSHRKFCPRDECGCEVW